MKVQELIDLLNHVKGDVYINTDKGIFDVSSVTITKSGKAVISVDWPKLKGDV